MENAKSVPVNEVLFTEIEKLLEPYKKQLPGGYKTFFERRIESKDFEEAHERLQRKILWESIVPGPVGSFFVFYHTQFPEKWKRPQFFLFGSR